MSTDRYPRKTNAILSAQAGATARYPLLWQRIKSEWTRPGGGDRAWLSYSANYLFQTGTVRWALDPLTLRQRLAAAPEVDVSFLADLDYVVLSHRHADHFDSQLLPRLMAFPAHWIIPEFMRDALRSLGLPEEKILLAKPAQKLLLGGLSLTPFPGLHWEKAPDYPDGQRGVPSLGYLAEFSGKRILIPGDTRSYDASQLPNFGGVDCLFAHVWLGRGMALQDEYPLLEPFCRFILDLSPRRVLLTHLEEFGREAREYWDDHHVKKILSRLGELAPGLRAQAARMGDTLEL